MLSSQTFCWHTVNFKNAAYQSINFLMKSDLDEREPNEHFFSDNGNKFSG